MSVCNAITHYDKLVVIAEKIESFGQGSKGSFTFGIAICLVGNIQNLPNVELVTRRPMQWKPALGLDSNKSKSIMLTKQWGLTYHKEVSSNLAESFLLAKISYMVFKTT